MEARRMDREQVREALRRIRDTKGNDGKGLAGVVVKDDRYFNPFIEAMKGRVAE